MANRYDMIGVMIPTTTTDCSKCSDTGYVGATWILLEDGSREWEIPENVAWSDREFCDCAEGNSSWQSEQDDAAYSHAERCFTDHGYARGN